MDLGAYASYRWQQNDVPAAYLPLANPVPITASQVMSRGYNAGAFDAWLNVTAPKAHVEAEGAVLLASVDQPSLIPGVLLRQPVKALQVGFALESEFGAPEDTVTAGLDGGYASGNDSPGFGVNYPLTASPAQARGSRRRAARPAGPDADRQLPLPPGLSHRSHPLPGDHRRRHGRRLRSPPRALEHRAPRQERSQRIARRHRLLRSAIPSPPRARRARSASSSTRRSPTARATASAPRSSTPSSSPSRASTTPSSASERHPAQLIRLRLTYSF